MRKLHALAAGLAAATALTTPAVASAQTGQPEIRPLQRRQPAPATAPAQPSPLAQQALAGGDPPDVLLDIPNLSVEQISVQVQNLEANLNLDARLANLLHLTAGVNASIDDVRIEIAGVRAQATLIVRLDNVRAIIERTLQTLDNNPQIITQLTGTVDNAVNVTGGVLNNTVDTVGDLTGGLLRSGAVLDIARSGLSVVNETVNAAGETVRRVRASDGAVYEVVTDTANRILRSTRVAS